MDGWNTSFVLGCPIFRGYVSFSSVFFWPELMFASKLELFPHVHPGKLTWNLKITQLKRKFIFQTITFRFRVNLPGYINIVSIETENLSWLGTQGWTTRIASLELSKVSPKIRFWEGKKCKRKSALLSVFMAEREFVRILFQNDPLGQFNVTFFPWILLIFCAESSFQHVSQLQLLLSLHNQRSCVQGRMSTKSGQNL